MPNSQLFSKKISRRGVSFDNTFGGSDECLQKQYIVHAGMLKGRPCS
jgi:hypothetical protein